MRSPKLKIGRVSTSVGCFPIAGWKSPAEREESQKDLERFWKKKKKKDVSLAGTVKVSGPAGIGQSLGHLLRVRLQIKRSGAHWRKFLGRLS